MRRKITVSAISTIARRMGQSIKTTTTTATKLIKLNTHSALACNFIIAKSRKISTFDHRVLWYLAHKNNNDDDENNWNRNVIVLHFYSSIVLHSSFMQSAVVRLSFPGPALYPLLPP